MFKQVSETGIAPKSKEFIGIVFLRSIKMQSGCNSVKDIMGIYLSKP